MPKLNSKKAHIVVGLGYGDEGKGLTVNEICKDLDKPTVVRFSGGQQAGHTVHHNGKKHTFSNFGAGTMQGIPTYFTEHTTFYPPRILQEKQKLELLDIHTPKIFLHPMSRMTTPWDVHANIQCKDNRKHGTCGLGVGKTMARNEGPVQVRAIDMSHKETLFSKLDQVSTYYNLELTKELMKDIQLFYNAINNPWWIVVGYSVLDNCNLIFEGSQGIMLDMDHGVFPNVTYANTTSKNAMEVCKKLGIEDITVYGVTRAYSTRHGAGDYSVSEISLGDTHHETNKNNPYQGEFKVSQMDYGRLNFALTVEELYSPTARMVLVITCINQVSKEDAFNVRHVRGVFDHIYTSDNVEGNFKEISN